MEDSEEFLVVVDVPRGTKASDLEDGGILQWDEDGLGAKLEVREGASRGRESPGYLFGRLERILGSAAVVKTIPGGNNTESVVEDNARSVEVSEFKDDAETANVDDEDESEGQCDDAPPPSGPQLEAKGIAYYRLAFHETNEGTTVNSKPSKEN